VAKLQQLLENCIKYCFKVSKSHRERR